MRRRILRSVAAVAMMLVTAAALAQPAGYPARVVSLVIPYPPGGSADGMARPLAQQISGEWPSPVIILSKPGAGTTIGAGYVAASNPDGYTLYIAAPSHVISG